MNRVKILAAALSPLLFSCNKQKEDDTLSETPKEYKIVLTKGDDSPTQVTIWLDAEQSDQADVWIDLNNNGTKEDGEAATKFGGDPNQQSNTTAFSVGDNQTLTIHGRMTGLECPDSDIKSLDVSGNSALRHLDFQHNNIESIDLSKNAELQYLECYGNLELSALDVSGNPKLNYLSCGNMKLTSLDVSKNMALTELHCSINSLTTLDVSKNTSLKRLACRSNELSALDVSKNASLEFLMCYYNNLTSLDLSGNPQVKGMLRVWGNRLTNTDQLLNSLPTRSVGDTANLYLYDERLNPENVSPSSASVVSAKARKWRLYKFSASGATVEL